MWILYAVLASMLWGLTYVLNEQLYRHITVPTALAIGSLAAFAVMAVASAATGMLAKDVQTILASRNVLVLTVVMILAFVTAELFIGFSISARNATLAGLLEISYPIFIALFAFLLFGQRQLTPSAVAGGLLIMSGVLVIAYGNR